MEILPKNAENAPMKLFSFQGGACPQTPLRGGAIGHIKIVDTQFSSPD